ncbi:MAG: RHS repeat-associated core domain-containing protein [Byssovorax sp.]
MTDVNGNRAAAQVDELGRVVATAILGKVGDTDGDTLADPTTTFAYDLTRYQATGEPNVVHSRAREQHGAANTRWQEAYSYSDGSGHEVMKKIPAEPGLAPARDGGGALVHDTQGALVLAASDPRWVGTGRTVFDNKGNPVKQYEPFFSSTPAYEDETELVAWGVTPVLRYDALGRLIRTDLPNGTFSKVVFDAWKQTTYDPNDTVAESLWYQARAGLDPVAEPEGRAASLAYAHRDTPGVAHLDALGRTFLTMEDNGSAGTYPTHVALDIEGNPLLITDARGNTAMHHVFGMGGRALSQKSCDAGERWMLADVGGAMLRAWNERGHTKRATYDAARRATHAYVQQGTSAEQLVGRTVYGEAHPSAAALNLRGKAHQIYDGAGVVTSGAYDFKGNLLHGTRRLAADYHAVPDWSALAGLTDVAASATAAEALLEAEVFSSATAYDALNRPTSMTAPDASEIRPTYNEAGLLEKVEARVRGAAAWTTFVDDIDYDAKGQREKIVYGNGTRTTYTYDPETFRLVRLKTVRDSDGAVLQNLAYAYDPVGNIAEITDSAQQTVFFDNAVVSPSTKYVYDAIYRLIEATGREHAGGMADVQRDQNDVPLMNLPHANDAQALRNYVEQYVYDAVGNILTMSRQAGVGSWTRAYQIAATSNRLLGTSLPGDQAGQFSATYAYDAHGSMTSMPHLPSMGWDHNDQMRQVGLGGGGTAYSTYDAAGQRVRKVWEHSGLVEERIYLGGWELYRKRDSLRNLLLERETLHGMDGTRRVVLVETKTVDVDAVGVFTPVLRTRFQLDNHLGSASLEVDESGLVIGYEEYHPYGTTAYASGRNGVEVSGKRYRYTGKERDEETGLYYHGARHMAPWLGRWTSSDPILRAASNYSYAANSPIIKNDPDGRDPGGGGDATKTTEQMQAEKNFNDRSQKLAEWEARKPGFWQRPELVKAQRIEQALITSIANMPNSAVSALEYIGLGLTGHVDVDVRSSSSGDVNLTVSPDSTAQKALEDTAEWRITPPPSTERLSRAYDFLLPFVVGAATGGNPKPGAGPSPGAMLAESKKTVLVLGAEVAAEAPRAAPKAAPVAAPTTAAGGTLHVVEGGEYSASELNAARFMSERGNDVVLRPPVGTRAEGGTSDLLVNGMRYDVYTPMTANPARIISAIAKKNGQAEGIVLDLSASSVTRDQLGNVVTRVHGAGAKNIKDVIIMGGK